MHYVEKMIIEVIDEKDFSQIDNVISEIIEWSKTEDVSPRIYDQWVAQLEGSDPTLLLNHYIDSIRNLIWDEYELMEQNLYVLKCYVHVVTLHALTVPPSSPSTSCLENVLAQIGEDIFHASNFQNEKSTTISILIRTELLSSLFLLIETVLSMSLIWERPILSQTAAVLFAFSHLQITTTLLMPSLDQIDIMDYCTDLCPSHKPCNMGWNIVELDHAWWKDDFLVVASRKCWTALSYRLNLHEEMPPLTLIQSVCEQLGWDQIARALRFNFFGKDSTKGATVTKHSKPLHYPLNVPTSNVLDDPPYRREPARIHAIISFVAFLPKVSNHLILDDCMPILFTLIDSSKATWVAIGCAAMLVILEALKASSSYYKFDYEPLLAVLDLVIKAAADPLSVGLVGLVCYHTLQGLPSSLDGERRRKFLIRFIHLLSFQERHRSDESGMLRAILVGGMLPLLHQQYQRDLLCHSLDGVEVGKMALPRLLSLLSWDGESLQGYKVQVAALACLLNVMQIIHPILPHHVGKIMTTLIASWAYAKQKLSIESDDKKSATSDFNEEIYWLQTIMSFSKHITITLLQLAVDSAKPTIVKLRGMKLQPFLLHYIDEVENDYHDIMGNQYIDTNVH